MYLKLCQNLPTIYLWLKILKFTSKPIISTWIPNHTTSNSFPNVSVPYWFSLPKLSSTAGKLTFSFGCFLYFFSALLLSLYFFSFLFVFLCFYFLLSLLYFSPKKTFHLCLKIKLEWIPEAIILILHIPEVLKTFDPVNNEA